ncbi:serine/threonine-protein phosphatase 2A activator-like, partial [Phoenix dactylifera]|uniref:Serine/threonine-protein phosphatase 2A activator n=1 Tax=Phoenix dactylifera TaxID=42345 RepID=A0A8B9AI25_PHODC
TKGTSFGFVAALPHSVRGRKLSDPGPPLSQTLTSLVSLLQTLTSWSDEIPPLPHPARYGNPAYRSWHARLSAEARALLPLLSSDELSPAADELLPYLLDSFGNASHIDYGTGHETNFAAFLYCLTRLGLIREEDYPALVTRVFVAYLELVRKLQTTYCLEPAGSHGVWGLDDYHFLPFIFGSAQLIDHKYMKPKSIHNQDIPDNFSHEYMYLACVAFVKKVKKGVFAEHSPMLDDISAVPRWSKVNSGMLKMYKAEVLEKVPIMQHFLFGSLIKWDLCLRWKHGSELLHVRIPSANGMQLVVPFCAWFRGFPSEIHE